MTSTLPMDSRVPVEKVVEVIVKNEKGEDVKIVKRFQEYQITVKKNKKVDERRKWHKFGECDGKSGLENTAYGDEQFLVLSRNAENKEEEKEVVKCRICKKNHFTAKCPYKDALELSQKPQKPEKGGEDQNKPVANKYVAPSMRGGFSSAPAGSDVPSIMVSNLSQNATEKDLYELFGQFGSVSRVSIPKSPEGSSKGFAYVTYNLLDSAEKALKHLNGHRYDYLVLSLEFAKKKAM